MRADLLRRKDNDSMIEDVHANLKNLRQSEQ